MKMRLPFSIVLIVLLLCPPVGAATKDVGVYDRFFDPVRTSAQVGDAVEWVNPGSNDPHNVRQDRLLFYSGRESTTMNYRVVFSAGTFHYFCEIHGGPNSGMDGFVKVPAKIAAAPAGQNFTVTWATSASKSGSRFDVQYRIGSGDWRAWWTNTTKLKAVFGTDGATDEIRPGARHSFRVRSQKGTNNKAVSDWSPVASFTP
ncbi:MAG: hypothetical protein QOG16_1572 [Actinomycetota bacterium]|jgi:plastocyanin|nr:hypothetical protein [Actinomycetota bacterium]